MMMPGADTEAFAPSQWLSETLPKKAPYFPQIGDVLMYFRYYKESQPKLNMSATFRFARFNEIIEMVTVKLL